MGAPGWDDSPPVQLKTGQPKPVTFVYPYYDNPLFLNRQLDTWQRYNSTVHNYLRVIVVDDGSPNVSAETVIKRRDVSFDLRLFRIEVDIRWNWLAARNIGAHHAQDGWCLFTDMDHVVEYKVALAVIADAHEVDTFYRFNRREHTGVKVHPHPNSYLVQRKLFWKVGGYDEALSGYYGTDGDWRRRCASRAKVRILPQELVRYEFQDDSSTVRYKRKQPEDARGKELARTRKAGWRPKTLSFPYHEVAL